MDNKLVKEMYFRSQVVVEEYDQTKIRREKKYVIVQRQI